MADVVAELVVWGIPSCDTVKKMRAWLTAHDVPHRFADLRAHPPSATTVKRWAAAFGTKAMRNTSGGSYRALPEDKSNWSDAQWIAAFSADPMLLKRPIVERDGAALSVGFRPDDAARLLLG